MAASTAVHGLGHGQTVPPTSKRSSGQMPFKLVTPTLPQNGRWSSRLGDSPYSIQSSHMTRLSRESARTTTSEEGPSTPSDNPYMRPPPRRKPVPSIVTSDSPRKASHGLGIATEPFYPDSIERRGGFVESLGLAPILVSSQRTSSEPKSAPASTSSYSPRVSTRYDPPSHFSYASTKPPAQNRNQQRPSLPKQQTRAVSMSRSATSSDIMSLTSVEPVFLEAGAGHCETITFPHPRILEASPPRPLDLPRLRRQRDDDESSVRRVLRETDELNLERETWKRKPRKARRKKSLDLLRVIFERVEPAPRYGPLHLPEPTRLRRSASTDALSGMPPPEQQPKPERPPTLRQRSNSVDSVILRPVVASTSQATVEDPEADARRWKRVLAESAARRMPPAQKENDSAAARPQLQSLHSSDESKRTGASVVHMDASPNFDQLFFKLPTTSEPPVTMDKPGTSNHESEDETSEIVEGESLEARYRQVATPLPRFHAEHGGIASQHATPEQTIRNQVVQKPSLDVLGAPLFDKSSLSSRFRDRNESKTSQTDSATNEAWQTATEGADQTPEFSDWERFDAAASRDLLPESEEGPTPRPLQESWHVTEQDELLQSSPGSKKRVGGLSFLEVSPIPPVSFLDMSPPITPFDPLPPAESGSLKPPHSISNGSLASTQNPPPSPARSDKTHFLFAAGLRNVRARTSTGDLSSVGSTYDPGLMDTFPHPPSPWRRYEKPNFARSAAAFQERVVSGYASSDDDEDLRRSTMRARYDQEEGDATLMAMPSGLPAQIDEDSPTGSAFSSSR